LKSRKGGKRKGDGRGRGLIEKNREETGRKSGSSFCGLVYPKGKAKGTNDSDRRERDVGRNLQKRMQEKKTFETKAPRL